MTEDEKQDLASPSNESTLQADKQIDLGKEGKERSSHEIYRELESPVHEILGGLDVERDVELASDNKSDTQDSPTDSYLIAWSGPSDPENPRNWSFGRKWAAVFVVSSFTFISPVSSSMVAPALPSLSHDIGIHSAFESAMVLSIFVLAYAVGPLFFGPLSEVYGRVRVVQSTNIFYFIFNLACGFAKTSSQMLAFRFFAGLGGSAMLALGGGILADCFAAEQRGQAIGLYMLGPLLGPAYQLFLYGVLYLIFSTLPTLWTERYHESVGTSGLNYISLGIGFWFGAQITAPLNDRIYRYLKRQNNDVGRPEFRVPLMLVGATLCPVGLLIYGWCAQAHTHWIGPNIGTLLFAAGNIICHTCSQTYIMDSYTRYAASGTAAVVVLRSMAGFGFPLFAPYMYAKLDYGWGNSVLALVSICLGIPAPIIFWRYGEKLRSLSQFASGGL